MSYHWHENVGIAWCPCDEAQDAPGAVTAVPPRPAADTRCTCGGTWPCTGPAWMGDHSPERITSVDGVVAPGVGRCGDVSPSFIGSPPDICALPAGHPGWHRGDLPLHGRATEWSGARPAAPDATAGDGLRSVEWWTRLYLAASEAVDSVPYAAASEYPVPHAAAFRSAVEPALRDVLAAAARDAEAVARVREWHSRVDYGDIIACEVCEGEGGEVAPWPCDTIRALDGTP